MTITVQAGEVISTSIGSVHSTTVTSREVQIQNLLETALYEKDAKPVLLKTDSKEFHKAAQDTLLESAVNLEAQSFNTVQISSDDLADAEKQVQKVLKNNKVWKSLQVSSGELTQGLKRKVQC